MTKNILILLAKAIVELQEHGQINPELYGQIKRLSEMDLEDEQK